MLKLLCARADGAPPTVLCLGAHADDIEIGAGGTLLNLVGQCPDLRVHWVVFSALAERAAEARASATAFLDGLEARQVDIHAVRDGFFPAEFARLKELFERLKKRVNPDLIFTHYRQDAHQDHRTIAELTHNTFRDHLILEYEIPKYDPDVGNPTVFVPLSRHQAQAKVAELVKHFTSQLTRRWFVPETFYALMRLRGLQAAAPSGFAEGFYGARVALQFGERVVPAAAGRTESRHSPENAVACRPAG